MLRKLILTAISFLIIIHCSHGQVAGISTLPILNMPTTARSGALGMEYLSVWDNDINPSWDNPSLLDSRLGGKASFNFANLFSGANFASALYAHSFKGIGTFAFGLKYENYGIFEGYDELDNSIGKFYAADYVLSVGWGMHIDSCFTLGVIAKPIVSQYSSYVALAFGVDLAIGYHTRNNAFSATLMGRNIGAQILTFNSITEKLPFELSGALSYKLENAPFRFYTALNELQVWDLRYNDPQNPSSSVDPYTGEIVKEKPISGVLDNMFRHVGVGVELDIKEVFFLRVGYNYRKTRENKVASAVSMNLSGFSYGAEFRKKRFGFAFSRNNYHLGQAVNYISVTTSF